jgi:Lar family restriction alleviation protein
MRDKPDLLPCPFCGSTHIACRLYAVSQALSGAKTRRGKPELEGYSVECLSCQASVHVKGTTENDKARAVERWNRRAENEPARIAAMKAMQAEAAERHAELEEEARVKGREANALRARDLMKNGPPSEQELLDLFERLQAEARRSTAEFLRQSLWKKNT